MAKLSSVRFKHHCNLAADKPRLLGFSVENHPHLTDAIPMNLSAIKRAIREALSLGMRTVSLTTDFLIDGVRQTSNVTYEASSTTERPGVVWMMWQLVDMKPTECVAQESVGNEPSVEQQKEAAAPFKFSKEEVRDSDSFYITPWLRVTRKGIVIDDIARGENTIPSIEVAVADKSNNLTLSCRLESEFLAFSNMVIWTDGTPTMSSVGVSVYRDRDNNSFNARLFFTGRQYFVNPVCADIVKGERDGARLFEITLEVNGGEIVACVLRDSCRFPGDIRHYFGLEDRSSRHPSPVYREYLQHNDPETERPIDPRVKEMYSRDVPRSSSRWQPSREISDTFDRRSSLLETEPRSRRSEPSTPPVLFGYNREKTRLVENYFPQVLAEIANNPKAYLDEDYREFILDARSVVRDEELPDDMLKGLSELHWGSNAEFYEKGVKIWAALLYLSSRRGR